MRVKKVPLQDLELWPDEVICFAAYTDMRNPAQQRRTYVDGDKLKAENAQLRQQLTDVTESMGRVDERCAKLRAERDEWRRVAESKQDIIDHMRDANAENAKLRKLAHIFMHCINEYSDCDECILNDGKGSIALDHLCACDGLHELLRELGLEKDA